MLIYKEELPKGTLDYVTIDLPANTAEEAASLMLSINLQGGRPMVWYQADAEGEKKTFTILAIGTGHPHADHLTRSNYIGTILFMGGRLVLHYFIVEGDIYGDLLSVLATDCLD